MLQSDRTIRTYWTIHTEEISRTDLCDTKCQMRFVQHTTLRGVVVKRDKGNTYWARFLTSRNHSFPTFIIISIFFRYISSRPFISLFHTSLASSISYLRSVRVPLSFGNFCQRRKVTRKSDNRKERFSSAYWMRLENKFRFQQKRFSKKTIYSMYIKNFGDRYM